MRATGSSEGFDPPILRNPVLRLDHQTASGPTVTIVRLRALFLLSILPMLAATARGDELLPGFRTELVANAAGFVTSIAVDANDALHYSTGDGGIWRVESGLSVEVARVVTAWIGNAALLGIAFAPDGSIVAHHVAPDRSADILSRVDPASGAVVEIARFPCAITAICSTEHHGGNPVVLDDGTILVAIGDLAKGVYAQDPTNTVGKVFRVTTEGNVEMFAMGFRNPFDMAWDAAENRLILGDNGEKIEDEINFVVEGGNYGWAVTMGTRASPEGMTPPVYTFHETVAPTGLTLLDGTTEFLRQGLIIGAWVTRALYYFPSLDEPLGDPMMLLTGPELIIDVIHDSNGILYYTSTTMIHRLLPPLRGDVNGDGLVTADDLVALETELLDGDGDSVYECQGGSMPSSWGADVNEDGLLDDVDLRLLRRVVARRQRGVRPPGQASDEP